MATQTTRDLRTRLIAHFEGVGAVFIDASAVASIRDSSEEDSDDVLDKEAVDDCRRFCDCGTREI